MDKKQDVYTRERPEGDILFDSVVTSATKEAHSHIFNILKQINFKEENDEISKATKGNISTQ